MTTRFRRLRVERFGAIDAADVALGPGLNVLYGPNDLGKSTLGDALRLALLLPAKSTAAQPFVPWLGGGDPSVELELQIGPRDIWSISKRFGSRGSATLRRSKDGRDFDEWRQGRDVDRTVRELLRWGLPDLGGASAPRGMATSFLATALLSMQAGVADVLERSLAKDLSLDGRERVAEALAAVAVDPLYQVVAERAEARRDEAYTGTGAKSQARDSVVRRATDLVKQRADEKLAWEQRVAQTAGVEEDVTRLVRELGDAEADADARLAALAAAQTSREAAARRHDAEVAARAARAAVDAVRRLDESLEEIARAVDAEVDARRSQEAQVAEARAAEARLQAASPTDDVAAIDAATRARDDALAERSAAADRADAAERALADVLSARQLEAEARDLGVAADAADAAVAREAARVAAAGAELEDALREQARCGVLARARDLSVARREVAARVAAARAQAEASATLAAAELRARETASAREALRVPSRERLRALVGLEREVATARAALGVGLAVAVEPLRAIDLAVEIDGASPRAARVDAPWSAEAVAELSIVIEGVGRVRVTGGGAAARSAADAATRRWLAEGAPVLAEAGVSSLDELDALVTEAARLDEAHARARADAAKATAELSSFDVAGAGIELREEEVARLTAALGRDLEAAVAEVEALGPAGLAARAAAAARREAEARAQVDGVELATLRERAAQIGERHRAAVGRAAAAVAGFSGGLAEAERARRAELELARAELRRRDEAHENLARELARGAAARDEARRSEAAARVALREAREQAEAALATTNARLAELRGRASQAREQRLASDLPALVAEADRCDAALAVLPAPHHAPTEEEARALAAASARASERARELEGELQRRRGALEQLGGHVARERLAEAVEAFEAADRHLKALEKDYAAWKLLHDTLKDAQSAHASNLGAALAASVGAAFSRLTGARYGGVALDADLMTGGVVVGDETRAADRLSVGTREQLSTLLRLCLAERLDSPLLLDDQLVQSDAPRMRWLRELLLDKSGTMQLIVLTCRPEDYVDASALPDAASPLRDSQDGRVRAVDLARVIRSGRRS